MKFELDSRVKITNGDFNCYVKDSVLFVPEQIFSISSKNRRKTVEDLLDLFMSFPGIIAGLLNFDLNEFKSALKSLQTTLRGQVEEYYLVEHNPPQHSFGALPPMNKL